MGYRSRIIIPLYEYFWRFKLTPTGRLLAMSLLLCAVGSISVEVPIYQVFCGLLGLLIIVEPIGLMMRPRLELRGSLPERVRADQPFTAPIRVTNRSWKPAFDVMAGLFSLPGPFEHKTADCFLPSIARGGTAVFRVTLLARRRGVYRLPPVWFHSTFPFNLMRFGSCKLPAQSVTVVPAYRSVQRLHLPRSQRYQPGGVLFTSRVGDSMEYIGNREYTLGEPVRRLDARAWARLGRPVVREYQEEYSCRVALILDTFVPGRRRPGPDGFPNLEAAVSLTAGLAEAMATGEFLIDVFAAGPQLHVFRSTGTRASFDSVLEILASVDVSRTDPFEQVSPAVAEELLRISTAICILLDWDERRRRLAEHILEAGCALKVIVVRDTPTTLPLTGDAHLRQVTVADVNEGRVAEV